MREPCIMACVKKIQGLNDKGDETDLEFLLIVTRVKPALATTSLQQPLFCPGGRPIHSLLF